MDEGLVLLIIVPIFALIVWSLWFHFARSRHMVEEWANQNGYDLLACEARFVRKGPFWWRTSKHHQVYHFTVRDQSGDTRSGYIRCGGWILGMFSDAVAVEWD